MRKQLMKGNEAILKSAALAGCRALRISGSSTSEITELLLKHTPMAGGTFLQAEKRKRYLDQHAVRSGLGRYAA